MTDKQDLNYARDEEDELIGPVQFFDFLARATGYGIVIILALAALLAAAIVYPR